MKTSVAEILLAESKKQKIVFPLVKKLISNTDWFERNFKFKFTDIFLKMKLNFGKRLGTIGEI